MDGSLVHSISVLLGDIQCLDIESEARNCHTRKHRLGRLGRKSFETGLRVEHVAQHYSADHEIEHATHHVARVQVVEKTRAHEVARFWKHSAGNGDISPGLEVTKNPVYFARRVRQIGIREYAIPAASGQHPASDARAFAPIDLVAKQRDRRIRCDELAHHPGGGLVAAVIDEDEFRGIGLGSQKCRQLGEARREAILTVVGRNHQRQVGNVAAGAIHQGKGCRPHVVFATGASFPSVRRAYFTFDMANTSSIVLTARALERTVLRMADEIVERNDGTDNLVLVGIQRRGVQIAARIAAVIKTREQIDIPIGALDITLYRDDLQTVGPRPVVGKTHLPVSIEGARVVIVDDVLFTGRTIRAALDELADFGRPARVGLAVLIDRGGRELPIQPDVVGKLVEAPPGARVDVFITELDGRDEVVLDLPAAQ